MRSVGWHIDMDFSCGAVWGIVRDQICKLCCYYFAKSVLRLGLCVDISIPALGVLKTDYSLDVLTVVFAVTQIKLAFRNVFLRKTFYVFE